MRETKLFAIFLSPICPVANKGPERKVGFNAATILAADAKAGIGKRAWNYTTIQRRNSGHSQRSSNARLLTIMPQRKVENQMAWDSKSLIQTRSEEPADILRALLKRS